MFTFDKSERLCSQKQIDILFRKGERMMVFPYSVTWRKCDADEIPARAQVLIATSKKKFHHAVDRNRVKRLTRECYRLHKPALYQLLESHDTKLIISINYIHTEIMDYHVLYKKFDKILTQLEKNL